MSKRTKVEMAAAKSTTERVGLFIMRYPPIAKIRLDPMRVTTSKDRDIVPLLGKVRKPVLEGNVESGTVRKWFIPLDISDFSDTGITIAKGPVKVEKHRHPGVMFTVLTDGNLSINGTRLEKHDWYLVPPGNEYEIESTRGYESVFFYVISC